MKLEEELQEKRKREEQERKQGSNPTLSPQQRIAEAEITLKAIKAEQEVASVNMGYADFQSREKTIGGREKALTTAQVKLAADQQTLIEERTDLLSQWEKHKAEYQNLMAQVKIREESAEQIMAEAISEKAEADRVIESRTDREKGYQIKHDAYVKNLGEAYQSIIDMITSLRTEGDPTALQLAVDLNRDLELMDTLNEKQVDLQTIADIFSVDCDRIYSVCEYIQNSKRDFGELRVFLLTSAEWLREALLIQWTPNDKEGTLN